MDRIIYDRMAELDTKHWWYRARRDVLHDLIARNIAPPKGGRILEVGCGTGHNIGMLGKFGAVDAVELDPAAREMASRRSGLIVKDARLPELGGIESGTYAVVAALDVVEHVEDDRAALQGLARCLAPGGRMLVTVPAFPFLWSAHDVANHHFRRYTKMSLRDAVGDAGLKLEFIGWFNSLLFPLAVADRMWGKLRGREGSDDALPPALLNAAFETIFALERHALGRFPMTPGVSLAAIISA
jgi:SAM-dependent methyltransferase